MPLTKEEFEEWDLLIKVLVKTESKRARVETIDRASFVVYVDEKAIPWRANGRLVKILSDKFGFPKSDGMGGYTAGTPVNFVANPIPGGTS
jgi:uncharacterized protein YggU (UPF0235/DUF167 family)